MKEKFTNCGQYVLNAFFFSLSLSFWSPSFVSLSNDSETSHPDFCHSRPFPSLHTTLPLAVSSWEEVPWWVLCRSRRALLRPSPRLPTGSTTTTSSATALRPTLRRPLCILSGTTSYGRPSSSSSPAASSPSSPSAPTSWCGYPSTWTSSYRWWTTTSFWVLPLRTSS